MPRVQRFHSNYCNHSTGKSSLNQIWNVLYTVLRQKIFPTKLFRCWGNDTSPLRLQFPSAFSWQHGLSCTLP